MKDAPLVKRPWGGYSILKKSTNSWVKRLYVEKGARLSLQSHELRDEVWYVLSGTISAVVGSKTIIAHEGEMVFVPKKTKHRIVGVEKSIVLEVAFGRVLEGDIVRFEDDYGRTSN